MARIRSVHPGIWTDEAFMALTAKDPAAGLLLIGLWTESDDSGVFEWKPVTIKARVLPAHGGDLATMLDTLSRMGFIRQFKIGSGIYGVIRNFVKFQRPKSPKDVYPKNARMMAFAGFSDDGKRPNATTGRKPMSGTSSEVVRNEFGTGSGISAQMEDEGGRREKKEAFREENYVELAVEAPTRTKPWPLVVGGGK